MTSISISDFKKNPTNVLVSAEDYPVAVLNRNKTAGYVVGKDMFEKLVDFVEDYVDKKSIEKADYKNTTPLNDLVKELGLE